MTSFLGVGTIVDGDTIEVTKEDKSKETIKAKNIVIATGSKSTTPPGIEIDEQYIVSSTGALSFDRVPKELVVVGGGIIGLELVQ